MNVIERLIVYVNDNINRPNFTTTFLCAAMRVAISSQSDLLASWRAVSPCWCQNTAFKIYDYYYYYEQSTD